MATLHVDKRDPKSAAREPRRRRWLRYALVILVVAAMGTFYLSGLWRYVSWESMRANLETWQGYVARHVVLAVVVFFCAYATITALSLPAAAAMTLVAGALFGRVLGTAMVSAASTLGATLAFLASRYLFRDGAQSRYGHRLRAINEGIERDGAYYLFMLRLVPLVPFFLINLGMGLTPIGVGTYVVTSWLGMLLGTILYVNAGTAIATIESPGDVLSPTILVSLAALGVIPLLIRKIVRWRPASRPS
ncbi:MAG: TVP38/TMEM64 family protein [Pirellulales bacterium]